MNLGKAYLENRDSKQALEVLHRAIDLRPKSAPALRNLGRAYRLAGRHEDALGALGRAEKADPGSVATSYIRGLTFASLLRFEEAVRHLEEAVRLDPDTAALRFQLAGVYETTGKLDRAAEQLRETVRIDPLHASAYYKLASHARRAGDAAEMRRRHQEFTRLRKLFGDVTRNATALEQCVYMVAESAPVDRTVVARGRPAPVAVRWVLCPRSPRTQVERPQSGSAVDGSGERGQAARPDLDRITAAAVIDVDEAGRCTLFVAEADGGFALLKPLQAGEFQRTAIDLALPGRPRFTQCVIGDFHNDVPEGARYDPNVHAINDVLLNGPDGLRLIKRTGPTAFHDATEKAGLAGLTAKRARWVDYEHDGDLDLVLARTAGLALWQNNGDGRFEEVTDKVGIGGTGPVWDVVGADLNANVAVDLIAARGAESTLVFENQRAGRFAAMAEPPGPWPTAKTILVDDLNNDGYPDSVLIGNADRDADSPFEAVVLLSKTPARQRIDLSDIDVAGGTLLDFDNDGWLDVCLVGTKSGEPGAGIVRLLRNVGDGKLADVGPASGLASLLLPAVVDVLAADFDLDGDTDLLLVASGGGLRFLRNDGGNANRQLKVRLTALKTNPAGLGTHIELRQGSWWVTRTVARLPIEIGLGRREKVDSLQVVWTSGIVDNRTDVGVSSAPLTLVEKNVAAGSCPFLYVWDGSGFRFVTDLLGNSPIGLPLTRDVMLPADPEELVYIGHARDFSPRAGAYIVVITDEFREVVYLDHARLLAVDHPADVEVHPTDKLMPAPFPRSELWAMGSPQPLLSVRGSDGLDRTEAVRTLDGLFAPPGLPLPAPFRGMCHPMSLTLDFGPMDAAQPLVLALTGWLQYGDASTNIAMSQSSALTIIPPTLEVQDSGGHWRPVELTVGMPAGKTKTILCDLTGKLPPGARRLRLTTTFEIRWDRIALFERRPLPDGTVHEVLPNSAELRWRGFSQIKARAPAHPTTPDFDVVSDRPPWRTALEGWCTRYGDVLDLVRSRDDRLVVMNSGDALTLRFDAARFPAVPEGLVRTFFFYSVGWDKDGDHNVTGGDRVEPLPRGLSETRNVANDSQDDWRIEYNTRWVPRDRFRPGRHGTAGQATAWNRAGSASDR